MGKEIIIKQMLYIYNTTSLYNLRTRQLATIYDAVCEPSPFGSAMQICDESNHDEREKFSKVLIDCLQGKREIQIYRVQNEGVRTDGNDDYFMWCERHSCWYQ
jgi:hypothetical protein